MTANPLWGEDWQQVRDLWALDPDIAHCNHGSFGAVPLPVLEIQEQYRRRMVANPMRWFSRDSPELVARARAAVAGFLHADPADTGFVTNVSSGVSAVLRSLSVAGEVLTTDHAYGAVSIAVDRFCERTGATRVVAPVPLDSTDDDIVAILTAHCSERTGLVVVDHVTSATARRFPVRRIARVAHDAGALLFVDGAHAPGMLPVDVPAIGADFWVGNMHKWPCAPAGTGVLWVAPAHRADIHSLVISHADHEGFPVSFEHGGTNDLSAWISAPNSLELFGNLGWDRVRAHNEALVRRGQHILADILGMPTAGLRHDPGLSMALVPLPGGLADSPEQARALQNHLVGQGIEMVTNRWGGVPRVRLSAQVYNSPADYERLALAIRAVMVG
ncbi:MAG TPA: aminotransferase class V-fold PLP-dependent enzyme [Mycobacteriales bacterium]|nr:aminotransferase class V-fold PLP-dependent enzyme [Mycobacteriales bacterium]